MINTTQSILIDAPIDGVWEYIKEIGRWANLFPGCKEFTVLDAQDSRWTLKVGAGGLVRTVKVLVHIDQWDGPQNVRKPLLPMLAKSFAAKLKSQIETAAGHASQAAGSSGTVIRSIRS